MDKVYLDTNVLIEGPRRSQHIKLVELSRQEKIQLFYSVKNDVEMGGKIIAASKKRSSISLFDYDSFSQAQQDYKHAIKSEELEWDFWEPAKLIRTRDSFNAIIDSSYLAPLIDFKGELKLWGELIEEHKVSPSDAVHLMHVHSGKLDYLLTWDDKLIKKSKNVKWLNPTVCTPEKYLNSLG